MRSLTDAELYRLFVFGDWDLSLSDPEGRLQKIIEKAKTDPVLAAEIDQINADFAAQQRDNWPEGILAE